MRPLCTAVSPETLSARWCTSGYQLSKRCSTCLVCFVNSLTGSSSTCQHIVGGSCGSRIRSGTRVRSNIRFMSPVFTFDRIHNVIHNCLNSCRINVIRVRGVMAFQAMATSGPAGAARAGWARLAAVTARTVISKNPIKYIVSVLFMGYLTLNSMTSSR